MKTVHNSNVFKSVKLSSYIYSGLLIPKVEIERAKIRQVAPPSTFDWVFGVKPSSENSITISATHWVGQVFTITATAENDDDQILINPFVKGFEFGDHYLPGKFKWEKYHDSPFLFLEFYPDERHLRFKTDRKIGGGQWVN